MSYQCATSLAQLRRYLDGAGEAAFDIETAPDEAHRDEPKAALDPRRAHVVGVSFSRQEGTGVYVPVAHRAGRNAREPENIWAWLAGNFFNSPSVTKVCHNIAFEAAFLYARGIALQPPAYDTMLAAQLTLKEPRAFRSMSDCGLKTLAAQLLGTILPSFEAVTGGRHYDELDPQDDETVRYACADSDYALRLRRRLGEWFEGARERTGLRHGQLAEQAESPAAIYAGIMRFNGLPVDAALMAEKRAEAEGRLARLRREIGEMTDGVDIGANAATGAFKSHLYKTLGLPVFVRTEKDREAANDEALTLLAEHCEASRPELAPLFRAVAEYRRWGKLLSTYIDGYAKQVSGATGRLHPDLRPLGTATGRFSSRSPNMQNMPRPDGDPMGVRNFIAAPEGKALLSLDLSQIELRVGAFYCRDKRMLGTYRDGGDIHAATTSVIYRIPFEEAADKSAPGYKERRTIAKNCNFGVFYGLFPNGLMKNLKFNAGLDTELKDCAKIISNLKNGYPGLARWQEGTKRKAAMAGYTETWLGRRRYLPGLRSGSWGQKSFAERISLNHPIQGTAAEILKLAMGRVLAGLPGRPWLKPILQIHDELLFEVPAERAEEAAAFVKGCMEARPFPEFDVPIVADASVGRKYGSMEELR